MMRTASIRAEVRIASKSQAGHQHRVEGKGNEDAVFVADEHPFFDAVMLVADGMGGHPRANEASGNAVEAARRTLYDRRAAGDPARAAAAAVEAAQHAVRSLHTARTGKPPGTTLSIALVSGGVLQVAHVGDSSVILMRDGEVRTIAGGEQRRLGNRPEQFIGQEAALEVELQRFELAEGDRVLLCTDGLTRYFNEAGPEALERILGRTGVNIESVAGQLIAHSRAGEYDDDTTVALLEVAGFTERLPDRPSPPVLEPAAHGLILGQSPVHRSGPSSGVWLTALLAAAAVAGAGGFYAGRLTAPKAGTGPVASGTVPDPRPPIDDAALAQLPQGNVILVDPLGKRMYALATRASAAGTEPISLTALRVGENGRLSEAGRFRLDPVRGELTNPAGEVFPVEQDLGRGVIRILRGATLAISSRPRGAEVWLDGKRLGKAPQRIRVAVGPHTVRVVGQGWVREQQVEVGASQVQSVLLERPAAR